MRVESRNTLVTS